jgi:hypothetical protein
MLRSVICRVFIAGLVLVMLSAAAGAVGSSTMVVRVVSLDVVEHDALQISSLVGVDFPQGWLLETLKQASGLDDLSWVDRNKPLAVVMPSGGMLLGDKGIVSVLPATDPTAALAVIERSLGKPDSDTQGIRRYLGEDELIVLAVIDHYLVVGRNGDLVKDIELENVLGDASLPAGSLTLDVNVKELAPMILMGMQAGRQMLTNELLKGDSMEGDGEQVSPEFTKAMLDMYFEILTDVINNTGRLQLSLELTETDAILHKRIEPTEDSTLAGLMAVQDGGLPELARYIDPGDEFMAMAGQINVTPALQDALKSLFRRYMSILPLVLAEAPSNQMMIPWLDAMASMDDAEIDKLFACYGGSFAATFGITPGGPVHMTQLLGVSNRTMCQEWMDMLNAMLDDMQSGDDTEPMIEIDQDAFVYRGVAANRQLTRLEFPAPDEDAEMFQRMMAGYLGDQGIVSYYGLTDAYMLQTMGAGAEDYFKTLVDRVSAKKKHKKKMVGLTADHFAPLKVGPGAFYAVDIGVMMQRVVSIIPEEAADLTTEITELIGQVPVGSMKMVMSVRFDEDALVAEWSIPFKLVELVKQLVDAESVESQE